MWKPDMENYCDDDDDIENQFRSIRTLKRKSMSMV